MKNETKIIINCPGCQHRVRLPKYKNLIFTCPKCGRQVSYNGKINKKPYYIGFVALACLIAYFVFFKDYFAYLNVKDEKTKIACEAYYNSHPRGYFLEEVSFIEVSITKDIELVRGFLKTYPDSDKSSEVLKFNKNLWDSEIEAYDKTVAAKKGLDPKAVSFFRNLLGYMRDHNESTLFLELEGDVDVKNFDKYEPKVKKMLDSIITKVNGRNVSDNIADIESNYHQGYISAYEDIIKGAVESGFENILSHNFIKVSTAEKFGKVLKIKINYNIKNQENQSLKDNLNYPVIWTYTEGKTREKFISFLIGISINYNFNIELPESKESFGFEQKTNALDNISNITNIEEGYKRMTAQNFNNYGNVISKKFGLIEEVKNVKED